MACGGSAALLNLVVFFFANNYILPVKGAIPVGLPGIGYFYMQHYTAAFIIALLVSFPVGFALNKYVVFQESQLKGRIQLFRYGIMTGLNIFLNWALLHFFVGLLQFWATPAQAVTTILLAILSYFAQTHFSFRSKKSVVE
jgi:putative flippase GtrA